MLRRNKKYSYVRRDNEAVAVEQQFNTAYTKLPPPIIQQEMSLKSVAQRPRARIKKLSATAMEHTNSSTLNIKSLLRHNAESLYRKSSDFIPSFKV